MRQPALMRARPAIAPRELAATALGALAVALLAAAWLLARREPFALAGDNLTLTYALLAEATRRLASGDFPLWTTARWGGSPLAGDPVVGALYPLHWIGFLTTPFPHERALDLDVALHLVWLGLGTAWWLAELGVRPRAAIAGFAFLLLNPTMIVVAESWIQYWAALSWWPWLFAAALRVGATGAPSAGVVAALALALQVYAGYPEFALDSGLAALACLALGVGAGSGTRRDARARGRDVARAVWIGAGAIALAAPQILPGLEMARESIRSGPAGEAVRALMRQLAITPAGWIEVLSPLPVSDFAPFRLAPGLLALAILGGIAAGDRRVRAVGAVAATSALLATGALHDGLAALPGFAFFPAPAKFFYLFVFAVLGLAAVGLDRARALREWQRRALVAILAASCLPALRSLAPDLWWIAAVVAGAAALLPARALAAAVFALALASAGTTTLATGSLNATHFFGPGRFRALLERPLPTTFAERTFARALALEENPTDVRQVGLNFAGLFDQASWNGIGPLAQSRQLEVMERIAPGAAAAVATAVGASPLAVRAGGALEGEIEAAGFAGPATEGGLRILFAPDAVPRYGSAADVRFAPRAESIAAARVGAATPPRVLVVEHRGSTEPAKGSPTAATATIDGETSQAAREPATVAVVESRPGFARLDVTAERATWVLAREPYYPGWRATADGAPLEIRPAGGFLLAFEVPAGRHTVSLEYREPGFARGAVAALIALVGLPLALVRQARRGRK